jgi:hypothetical protein
VQAVIETAVVFGGAISLLLLGFWLTIFWVIILLIAVELIVLCFASPTWRS